MVPPVRREVNRETTSVSKGYRNSTLTVFKLNGLFLNSVTCQTRKKVYFQQRLSPLDSSWHNTPAITCLSSGFESVKICDTYLRPILFCSKCLLELPPRTVSLHCFLALPPWTVSSDAVNSVFRKFVCFSYLQQT